MKKLIFLTVLLMGVLYVAGDVYLQNPRGSNNRLNEQGRQRNNERRMFDSQNNNRGGYNVGNLYYYTGSRLQVEWTNQHSCKSPNANCDIILQYMCQNSLRDGSDTRTIPESNSQCAQNDCNSDNRFGMNENNDYYQSCKRRSRNKGLFIADQKLGDRAINTRQNPNGVRFAYECPEEKDYYPYWQPTPWIDIAVLTNEPRKCDFFQAESENVKSRWYCAAPLDYNGLIPINREECEKIKGRNGTSGEWKESLPNRKPAPICHETQYTRDNHLGNTIGGNTPTFNWTLPDDVNEKCVLRIRYNVSTGDYDRWTTTANNLTSAQVFSKMGLSEAEAKKRNFLFRTNPSVQLFADLNLKLNLAINTAQFGRVFEDRSHVFAIRKRPVDLNGDKILNLNVRGKRGNIVQVYPATEYDFVPNRLELSNGDVLHIQWTGSNTNPPNNAGQGLPGTDRSNIVLLRPKTYVKGNIQMQDVYGQLSSNLPAHIQNSSYLGLSKEDMTRIALLKLNQIGGDMSELDDAGTYFDLGPRKITSTGVYNYMCTRNNNFSNRDQKAQIVAYDHSFNDAAIGWNGGSVANKDSSVTVDQGAFQDLVNIRLETKSREQLMSEFEKLSDSSAVEKIKTQFDQGQLASEFVALDFPSDVLVKPIKVEVRLKRGLNAMERSYAYRISSNLASMQRLEASTQNSDRVNFETKEPGVYVVKSESNYSVLIGSLVGVGVVLIIGLVVGLFLWRNPKYLRQVKYSACNAKRSLSNDI